MFIKLVQFYRTNVSHWTLRHPLMEARLSKQIMYRTRMHTVSIRKHMPNLQIQIQSVGALISKLFHLVVFWNPLKTKSPLASLWCWRWVDQKHSWVLLNARTIIQKPPVATGQNPEILRAAPIIVACLPKPSTRLRGDTAAVWAQKNGHNEILALLEAWDRATFAVHVGFKV